MFCFPQCRPCDFTVENCFFGISCYSHACVCTIYEKTKAKFPWDQALGESIMFKLKRSVGLGKSVIMLNRLCFVKQLSEHNFFYFCISLSGIWFFVFWVMNYHFKVSKVVHIFVSFWIFRACWVARRVYDFSTCKQGAFTWVQNLHCMILMPTSGQLTTKFPAHSALVKWKHKTCVAGWGQKIVLPIKSK